MRPDEQAMLSEIERDKVFRQNVKRGLRNVGGLATSFTALAPFLNENLPVDLAVKGINKLNPKIGGFLEKGKKLGLDVREGIDFIKDKFIPKEDERNPIEKYSPELYQFIIERIKEGRSPTEAAALATLERKNEKSFKPTIDKITKDYQSNWLDLVKSLFEKQQEAKESQRNINEESSTDTKSELDAIFDKIMSM